MAADSSDLLNDVETSGFKRAFLDALSAHHERVYQHARSLPNSGRISDFLFDLLTRLANKGRLDAASLNSFHSKSEHLPSPPSEIELTLPEGVTLTLEQALTFGAPPPSTHNVLSAMLAMGLNAYLKRKAPEERRAVIKRVVKLLPGVERLGNFVLTDYIDYACDTQEATMFWQLYVDHVAKVLEQRTAQSAQEEEPPVWTLSALLELEEEAPNALVGRRWELLRKHIGRILQCPQDSWRWRFARVLVERCLDHRLLYALTLSPAMIEDEQTLYKFLTRCHSKHISCALFIIQVGPSTPELINELLEYFEGQSLLDIGERALDIYTQLQLFKRPSRALQVLREGLLSILSHKLESEPVDVLLSWVKNNASAFRQCALLVDLVPEDRNTLKPRDHQLLERVLQSFFHAFTPLGVRHPLNNTAYHDTVVRAIVGLMRDESSAHAATLKSFTLNLPSEAHRWLPEEIDEPKRKLLLTYFMALTAQVLRRAARRLYASPKTRPKALQLYHLIIELYLLNPQEGIESGAYGPLVPIVHALYPDLISSEYIEPPEPQRLRSLASLLGQVEQELLPAGYLDGLLDQWTDRNRGRELVEVQEEPLPSAAPTPVPVVVERGSASINVTTARTLQTPIVLIPKRPTASSSALRAYLGLDLLTYLTQQALSLVGVKRTGDIIYSPERVTIRQHYRDKADQKLAFKEVTFPHDQLSEVQLSQPLRGFYYLLGLLTLSTSSLMGGYLIFAGVRGSESTLTLLGLCLGLFGFLFDAAASKRAQAASRRVIVELSRVGQDRAVAFSVDHSTQHGQALINALTAKEALHNEVSFQQNWEALSEQFSMAEAEAKGRAEEQEKAQEAQEEAVRKAAEDDRARFEAEMEELEEEERRLTMPPSERPYTPPVLDALEADEGELIVDDDEGEEPRVVVGAQRARSELRSDVPLAMEDSEALETSFDALQLQPQASPQDAQERDPDDSLDISVLDDSILDSTASYEESIPPLGLPRPSADEGERSAGDSISELLDVMGDEQGSTGDLGSAEQGLSGIFDRLEVDKSDKKD